MAAEEVILVLLGDQWLAAVPIFRLLAIAMFVGSAHKVTKWLYMSSGQTQRQLHWGLIHTPLLIVAVCIGATQGAYGIAMGYTLGTCALTYPSVALLFAKITANNGRFFGAPCGGLLLPLLPAPFVCSGVSQGYRTLTTVFLD